MRALSCVRPMPRPHAWSVLSPRALGFTSGKRWMLRGDPTGTLPPAPQQDCRLLRQDGLPSSLVSPPSLTPTPVYLPLPPSFFSSSPPPPALGNQSSKILNIWTIQPGAASTSASSRFPAPTWSKDLARVLTFNENHQVSYYGYSQMPYSQLDGQFFMSN